MIASGTITFNAWFEPGDPPSIRKWLDDLYLEFYAPDRWADDGGQNGD
jgi:hypothetical protein